MVMKVVMNVVKMMEGWKVHGDTAAGNGCEGREKRKKKN